MTDPIDTPRARCKASPEDLDLLRELEQAEVAAGAATAEMLAKGFQGQNSGWVLDGHGQYTVPGWCRLLRTPGEASAHEGALECLRSMGPDGVAATSTILARLDHVEDYLLRLALLTLESVGAAPHRVATAIVTSTRTGALVSRLMRILRPPKYDRQEWFLRLLVHVGIRQEEAGRRLKEIIRDATPARAALIAAEIAVIQDPGALVQHMIEALRDGRLGFEAASTLGWESERNARTVAPALALSLLSEVDAQVGASLASVHALLADAERRQKLLAARAARGERQARDAANEMAKLSRQLHDLEEALPMLQEHPSATIRDSANVAAERLRHLRARD